MKFNRVFLACTMVCGLSTAGAAEFDNGFEFSGYSRGGPSFTYNKDQNVKGGLTLGGDLQKYRLGNEGDSGYEIFLGKTFDAGDGIKYKFGYMLNKWNSGNVGTVQAYAELWGLDFAPDVKFWVGQRRLRIQDVHIVDHFLMNSGEYQGGGFSNLKLGPVNVAATLSSGDTFDTKLAAGTSANKLNIDIGGLQTNPGGNVRMLLTTVTSSGFASSGGNGFSVVHNQSDFLTSGLTNSLFLQTSSGLAKITGEFLDLTTSGAATVGVKSNRIADSINWQSGKFGGQALVAYQTNKADNASVTTTDSTLGGRISYGVTKNFKMLVEASTTQRTFDNGADGQTLNKITIAPTLSTGPDFWKRPELRFYVTYANWNDAAALANLSTFGSTANSAATKLQSQTLVGMQYEIWW
jgi:maltoporin